MQIDRRLSPRLVSRIAASVVVACVAIALAPHAALAGGTLTAEYFILPPDHPDVAHGADMKIVTGLLQHRLSPNGLPIVTYHAMTISGPGSGPIRDVDGRGELMWYTTAGKNHVRHEKTRTETLPFKRDAFFPDGASGDGGTVGYLAVHWSGNFTLAKSQTVGFRLGSDDDSWVFIDGSLVVDNGGVKPLDEVPYTSANLSAGAHRFDVFYADRHNTGAAIHLSTDFGVAAGPAPTVPKAASLPNAAKLAAAIHETGHVAVYGIHFAFDRADITRDSASVLAEVATLLKGDPSLRLRIEGHTDSAGEAGYNRGLSGRRADAVKAALVGQYGIASSRLTTRGFGPDRPVATNATSEGRAKNRRVELAKI